MTQTFTIDDLRAIFEAGIDQGKDVATSDDWGTVPRYGDKKAFFEAFRDLLMTRQGGIWVETEEVEALIGPEPHGF